MARQRERGNDQALVAFMAAKAEIDELLARLMTASADHFGAEPDTLNWGHVGSVKHARARLRELADQLLH